MRPPGHLFYSYLFYFYLILVFSPCFLPVSLSYFNLSVPKRKCLGEHPCLSSIFCLTILNGTLFFSLCTNWCFILESEFC